MKSHLKALQRKENESTPEDLAAARHERRAAAAMGEICKRILTDLTSYGRTTQQQFDSPEMRLEVELIIGAVMGALYMHVANRRVDAVGRLRDLAKMLAANINPDMLTDDLGRAVVKPEDELVINPEEGGHD